ncbi:Got1/Sft2-like family-domain-containing protein, partial [Thermoascus aurantiacus ATCC 26904]
MVSPALEQHHYYCSKIESKSPLSYEICWKLTIFLHAVSRWDRMLIFAGCNLGAAVCFFICFFLFPVLTLRPRKFAILWSVGSILFLASWAVLMGPLVYARHLVSGPRLPFTAAYFGSISLTLYFAVGLQSTFLTLISSIFQLAALVWYLVSYFPMGSTGLQFVGRLGAQRVTAWIN